MSQWCSGEHCCLTARKLKLLNCVCSNHDYLFKKGMCVSVLAWMLQGMCLCPCISIFYAKAFAGIELFYFYFLYMHLNRKLFLAIGLKMRKELPKKSSYLGIMVFWAVRIRISRLYNQCFMLTIDQTGMWKEIACGEPCSILYVITGNSSDSADIWCVEKIKTPYKMLFLSCLSFYIPYYYIVLSSFLIIIIVCIQ